MLRGGPHDPKSPLTELLYEAATGGHRSVGPRTQVHTLRLRSSTTTRCPWKIAIVLYAESDFTVPKQLLKMVERDGNSGADRSTSGSVSAQRPIIPNVVGKPSNNAVVSARHYQCPPSASSQPTPPHNAHHILPLVTLVQAAADLLNHIVEAGCAAPVAVSPRNRARSLPTAAHDDRLGHVATLICSNDDLLHQLCHQQQMYHHSIDNPLEMPFQ
jgi:hypothetical protein